MASAPEHEHIPGRLLKPSAWPMKGGAAVSARSRETSSCFPTDLDAARLGDITLDEYLDEPAARSPSATAITTSREAC